LHLYNGNNDVLDTRVAFAAGSSAYVEQTASGIAISANPSYDPAATALPDSMTSTSPASLFGSQNYVVLDTSNGQTSIESGQTYSGPVDYLKSQLILQTPDNVNVAPIVDNAFVHTGSGDDAISFAGHGGRNMADAGTGSNFLTSGNGNDTFFDDARGATKDIWNTIVNFHAGDAATLWGVTSQDYVFNWVDAQGAAGAQGLTLHAVSKTGGPTISVSFAGHSMSDLPSLAISENASANYTYLLQT
jgi:serralysin